MAAPILFFGDGSLPIHPAFSRILLARKDGSLLSLFLNRARLALQEEITRIPVPDRKGVPDLAELEALIINPGDAGPDHQYLAPAMLVMLQLGQFISWYEARPAVPYPDSTRAITVGLCVGQLSAAAISQARSLTELIPFAVESVRIAFRTGVVATTQRDELEKQVNPGDSWAITVPQDVGLSENNLLEEIHNKTGVLPRKKAYISAYFRKALTVQAPPSTLDSLESWISANRQGAKISKQRLPIYTPYHASHLYTEEDIQHILGPASESGIYGTSAVEGAKLRLISPVTGKYYSVSTRRELLEKALYDVLKEPIYWEKVCAGCTKYVAEAGIPDWLVQPFGPTLAAGALGAGLKAGAKVNAVVDGTFSTSDYQQEPTGFREPIAIVGMGGRFPESMSPDELWELLMKGVDCVKVIPGDRFDHEAYAARDGSVRNSIGTHFGCFMKQPGLFDPRFFNLSPREAEQTDPQQRLILTTSYEALEMSGFVPNRTPSTQLERIGTYFGQTSDDYRDNAVPDIQTYFVSGNVRAFGPGRVNHYFKFGGPSMSIDTACSSSAICMNVACTAIWSGECETALVGGMTLASSPDGFCCLNRAHFLNETGNCKTYDDKADGYCRGEAVVAVVIKRLSEAKADNDNILGVVLSTGSNYCAASHSITHPHGPTQEVLYRRLLNQAGIKPLDVDYVEMHGTGTQAGDAEEMSSVSNVFAPASPARPAEHPLWVGSVKSNVGHGESASGVTALIKTMLVLREQTIPPHVGIKSGKINHTFPDLAQRNIKIALDGPGSFPRRPDRKRRIFLNNFGAAGGNTAMVLEEAPLKEPTDVVDPRPNHVVGLSGKSIGSIKANIERLLDYLRKQPETSVADLSYTTTARRMHYPNRSFVVASTVPELKDRLSAALSDAKFKPATKTTNTIFTFTGQGALYLPLAQELFESSTQFRADILRFNKICTDQGFPSFLSVLDGSATDLDALRPAQTQLAITSVQMSLSRLWASFGIKPSAVIGHSLGEYAALFVCGILSANDTLYLVGKRALLLEEKCTAKSHCMISIHSTMPELKGILGDKLDALEVACINGPEDVVLSGPVEAVQAVQAIIKPLGLKSTVLNTPYAFHSAQVDPILAPFEAATQTVKFLTPTIPLLSPLLGSVVKEQGVVGPSYLCRHAREAVNFVAALKQAEKEKLATNGTIWLELGPNPVCLGMVRSTLGSQVRSTATLRKGENAWTTTSKSLSFLFNEGVEVNWNEYHRDFEPALNVLTLPSYAFDEKNYWLKFQNFWDIPMGNTTPKPIAAAAPAEPAITTSVHQLISKEVKGTKATLVFESNLSEPHLNAMIAGHVINDMAMCPAGVYADMAFTVGDYIRRECNVKVCTTGLNVTHMEILGPVTVPVPKVSTPQPLRINAVVDLETGKVDVTFGLYNAETKRMSPNASCGIEFGDEAAWVSDWSRSAYLVRKRMEELERGVANGTSDKMFKKMVYQLFSGLVKYGPNYHGMQEVTIDTEELEGTATVGLYNGGNVGNYFACPLWLDNLAQVAGFIMNGIGIVDPRVAVYISHGWESLRLAMPLDPTQQCRVHVKMHHLDDSLVGGNLSILQGDRVIGVLGDLKFQRVPKALFDTMLSPKSASRASSLAATSPRQTKATLARPAKASAPASPVLKKSSPARDSPVTKILEIIADEIGVSMVDLADDSDFAEMGVDSLLSLTILSKVREVTGIDLPPSTFTTCVTVADLKQELGGASSSSSDTEGDSTATNSGVATPELVPEPVVAVVDAGVVDQLHTVIAEEIGVDVEELLAADDLAELGVDSLMTLTIFAALREKLGFDLSPSAVEGELSLKGIKEALGLTAAPAPLQPIESPKLEKAKPAVSNVVLLQGNPNTAAKTVFLFPDGSGSATSYINLPEFAPDACVFAVNSPYLKNPQQFSCSLEEISQAMAEELRQRRPKGPYILAGWSAGGMYAYEAAWHLMNIGEKVEKLVLIDSPCRVDYGPMPQDVLGYVTKSGVISGSTGTAPQWLVDHFQSTIRAIKVYSPKPFDPARTPETYLIWAGKGVFEDWPKAELAGLDLSDPVAAWLLKPKANPGSLGWEKLISAEKISCVSVEGNHFSMVHPPFCPSLSSAMSDVLQADPSKRVNKWRGA